MWIPLQFTPIVSWSLCTTEKRAPLLFPCRHWELLLSSPEAASSLHCTRPIPWALSVLQSWQSWWFFAEFTLVYRYLFGRGAQSRNCYIVLHRNQLNQTHKRMIGGQTSPFQDDYETQPSLHLALISAMFCISLDCSKHLRTQESFYFPCCGVDVYCSFIDHYLHLLSWRLLSRWVFHILPTALLIQEGTTWPVGAKGRVISSSPRLMWMALGAETRMSQTAFLPTSFYQNRN